MRTRRLPTRLGPLCLLLLAAGSPGRAADVPEPRGDTLTQILGELRQLRRSLELTALLQLKVQVAAERLKVREPEVRALTEQAGHLERALAASAVDIERMRGELAQVEERIGQETSPEARRELGAQRTALAQSIGQMSAQEEENRRQAAAVGESLAAQRAEMDRMAEALSELERSLERHVTGGSERAPAPAEPPARPTRR
jgi:chromosome segregation ATPase